MPNLEKATFAGGCFWCTEAVFQRLTGVHSVTSGYTGGNRKNPSYYQVATGVTHHAEAIQIEFDPEEISYRILLDIFWHTHNPTTLNQQGNDIGDQYRSAIFYHSEEQQKLALQSQQELEKLPEYSGKIVTEIVPFQEFFPAESHHQNYYNRNTSEQYCQIIIDPKIQKLLKVYAKNVKEEYLK